MPASRSLLPVNRKRDGDALVSGVVYVGVPIVVRDHDGASNMTGYTEVDRLSCHRYGQSPCNDGNE